MEKNKRLNESFIVDVWEVIFRILSYISVLYLIKRLNRNLSYRFIEIWVVFNTTLSIVGSYIVYSISINAVLWFINVYALLRIFEIIVYQINVLLFDPYRAFLKGRRYKIKSPTRIIILLFHNIFEIAFWFATVNIALLALQGNVIENWLYYIKSNFLCILTFQTELVSEGLKLTDSISNLAFWEAIIGFIITIITLARFIGVLPKTEYIEEI